MTQSTPELIIRKMNMDELEVAAEWAAAEGWDPGLHDIRAFYALDPDGFFAAEHLGKIVGSVSAVAYDEHFGFIGFFIVKPEYRHHHFGIALGKHAIEHLGRRNIGVDGVIEQQDNYARSGFKTAYRNIRFELTNRPTEFQNNLVPVDEISFDKLKAFDRRFFPAHRDRFLKEWTKAPGSISLAETYGDNICGYGTIRPARKGYRIGPLFAEDKDTAYTILSGLISRIDPSLPVFIDMPDANRAALKMADSLSMKKVFETARMYTKEPPAIELDSVFGVTTFELG